MKLYGGVTRDQFLADLKEIRHTFQFVKLHDLVHDWKTLGRLRRPVACLTFDDGLQMRDADLLSILNELKVPATTFILPDCIDMKMIMWFHKISIMIAVAGEESFSEGLNERLVGSGLSSIESLREMPYAAAVWPVHRRAEILDSVWDALGLPEQEVFLQAKPYMTWNEVRQWIDAGHEVGCHSASHPFFSFLPPDGIAEELIPPSVRIREFTKADAIAFAYPFGDRLADEDLEVELMRKAGVYAMLGVNGVSRIGDPGQYLERLAAEQGSPIASRTFLKPFIQACAVTARGFRGPPRFSLRPRSGNHQK